NRSHGTTHIGLGKTDELLLTSEGFHSGAREPFQIHPTEDPLADIDQRLRSILSPGRRAFGYVTFDLCRYYFPYESQLRSPVMHFLVPEIEIVLQDRELKIIGPEDASKRLAEIITRSQAETEGEIRGGGIPVPELKGDDYMDRVSTSVRAIR